MGSFRHESTVARILMRDVDNNLTGQKGEEETFVKVDGLWYPERTIKAGAIGYRTDQLEVVPGPGRDSIVTNPAAEAVKKGWNDTLAQGDKP
jgi:hypothetical protein